MPQPAAGNWGLTSLTGFLEGGVLNVFASSPAQKAAKGGGRAGDAGAGAGAMQVQQASKQKLLSVGLPQQQQQQLCGATACAKPSRMTSSSSLESDLPELGRLERTTKTPNTSVATSDEEPACRRSSEVVVKSSDRAVAVGRRVATAAASIEAQVRSAPPAAAQQVHKPSKATGGAPRIAAATSGRWARAGGIPLSSASTLVPGMSPVVTPATGDADFRSSPALNKAGSSEDGSSSSTDDNNDKSTATASTTTTTTNNNIPAPLDLSAIPAPAPPLHRSGGGGGKFGSSGSSASKPVVLQGAALESLKRLGRPGSSVSDRSKGPCSALGSTLSDRSKEPGSARGVGGGEGGADMTVPLGAAIPMAVPLGAAVRPLGSNDLLSGKAKKQLKSREVSKDVFHTTGSVVMEQPGGGDRDPWREAGAGRPESLVSGGAGGPGGPKWARSESGVSGASSRGRGGGPTASRNHALAVGEAVLEDDGSSSDDNPPPPSPMLTAHLRGPQNAFRDQPKQQGRGRAFKGRGVRPQTWNEEDLVVAAGPRGDGGGGDDGAVVAGRRKNGAYPPGGEAQQQQQKNQVQNQNQMRLVARNPHQDVAANANANHDIFLNGQVSPGALSMVSCSTALSRHDPGFNDSDKHLDTLASMAEAGAAMAMARRAGGGGGGGGGGGNLATRELAPGLGRGAFEDISMSPGIPFRGNDLAGVANAMPSDAVPAAPVGAVPSLGRRRAALASGLSTSNVGSVSSRSSTSGRSRPHVLATQGSRSGTIDESFSASPTPGGGGRRADVPSLTVAHAPGKVYQPMMGGGGGGGSSHHHHKRFSGGGGAVPRGTPAHGHGTQHRAAGGGGGGDGGAAPFRLPSNIRLTSFGSRASSIASPGHRGGGAGAGSGVDWEAQGLGQRQQRRKDLGEEGGDTCDFDGKQTTMIDMLSTFGSGGGGGGGDKDRRRRHSSKRGDRISQRRSRSSGSQVGGSRRSSSGSIVAESDVRSSRDRRRSASRSMSGGELLVAEELANSSRTEENRRKDAAAIHDLLEAAAPEIGDSGQTHRHSSSRGRTRTSNKERSPPRSQSLRSGTGAGGNAGGGSSRRRSVSPSTSTSSKRSSARGGGGKHHKRRSSDVHSGPMANKSIFAAAATATETSGRGGGRGGGGARRSGRRSSSPRAKDDGRGDNNKQSSDAAMASSRRRRSRSRQDAGAGAVLTAPQEVDADEVDDTAGGCGDVKAAAAPLVVVGEEAPQAPRTQPVPVSPVDGREGQRRWSRSSKKPSKLPSSNPRSTGARKTATIKKRKVQRFLAIASLFHRRKSRTTSSSDGSDDDDERTAVATAVGVNTNHHHRGAVNGGGAPPRAARGFTRTESLELTNAARRSHGPGGFAGWLWRTITRQRGRAGGGSAGKRSPAGSSSGSWGGASPLPPPPPQAAKAAVKASSNNTQEQQQQQQSIGHSLARLSARRPKSMSRPGHSNSGSGSCRSSAVVVGGGCITQFYDAPAADENDTVETSGGAKDLKGKAPSAEEAAEARARVQQLLRTSQVHMNKHSSMRSGSFSVDFSAAAATAAAAAAAAGPATVSAGAGH